MKTINSKKSSAKNEDVKFFVDSKTGEYNGFVGNVALYDETIYVSTKDGIGYDKVICKLAPLIHRLATRYHFNGNMIEDTKQDIVIHILEGIPKYDPRKNTKLSTFLEMRINRRLINELRNKSRISRNATYLNIGTFNVTCKCGKSFVLVLDSGHGRNCVECGESTNNAKKKMSVNTPEVNESSLNTTCTYNNSIDEHTSVIRNKESLIDENIIFMHDMKNWLDDEDPRIVKVIELIYFHDYSIKAAAEKVGLSGAGANMKLKELSKNKKVRELFGR